MTQPDQTMPAQTRIKTELNSSLESKLIRYSAAAGAACAGILAVSPSASAEIVYTSAHVEIPAHHKLSLDLNHDGIADFTIVNTVFQTSEIWGRTLNAIPLGSNKVAGVKGFIETLYASALGRGAEIGSKLTFSGKLMAASGPEYGYIGKWRNVANRYLGLKLFVNGAAHYGWARFTVNAANETVAATLTGYAYETVANRLIVAGKTSGTLATAVAAMDERAADVTPDPSMSANMLGLLATGSPALDIWRKRTL